MKLLWKVWNGSTGKSAFIAEIWVYRRPAQQVCGCGEVLSVLLQEEKEEGFKDKDAQASYDQTP